jgi:shikimate dehydrogenase
MSGEASKRLAVLGHPVAHSRSPAMQNAALAELGLAGEWSYEAIDVAPDAFAARVAAMAGEGFVGANVTVPHKAAALAFADTQSETAREIGATNTLSFAGGEVHADNTDAPGLLAAVRGVPAPPRAVRALVLGAGGAARAAIWALARGGAVVDVDLGAFEVDVWNRTPKRAEAAAAELGGAPVREPELSRYGLIVNTTTVGLRGEDPFAELPLREDGFVAGQLVVDMVYGDEPSRLLAAAAAAGATTVDGLEVLVRQGALSLEIWTGREPPLDVMRSAARA